jgi:hypothetical protein
MKFWTRTVALACSVAPSSLRPTSAVNASAFVVQVSGSARSLDTSSSSSSSARSLSNSAKHPMADPLYPGTAVTRMMNVRARVEDAVQRGYFQNLAWPDVRRQILWAGGLRDFPDAIPGQGYTGHSFNDFNHVDLTCMNDGVSENENDGAIKGIAIGNRLGPGIRIASLEEVGPGGRYVRIQLVLWRTCSLFDLPVGRLRKVISPLSLRLCYLRTCLLTTSQQLVDVCPGLPAGPAPRCRPHSVPQSNCLQTGMGADS